MSKEIQVAYPTGATLYALVLRPGDGAVYNVSTPAFEAIADANWAHYAIALAEQGTASGLYEGTFPAIAAGAYTVIAYRQAGGSPAVGDRTVGAGRIEWSGTAEVPLSGIAAAAAQVGGTYLTGLVTAVTDPGTFEVTFGAPYGGTAAFLQSGIYRLNFAGGLNHMDERIVTGCASITGGGTVAALTFAVPFTNTVAVNDPVLILPVP